MQKLKILNITLAPETKIVKKNDGVLYFSFHPQMIELQNSSLQVILQYQHYQIDEHENIISGDR